MVEKTANPISHTRPRRPRCGKQFPRLLAAALSVLLCVSPLTIPAQAASDKKDAVKTENLQASWFLLQVLDENNKIVAEPVALSSADGSGEASRAFTLRGLGTTSGYCKVTVITDGTEVTKYISPIPFGTSVALTIQAPSGSMASFDYGWGQPDSEEVVAPMETKAAFSWLTNAKATLTACVEVSQTSIEYTVPQRATLEAIAAHYGVTPEEILDCNGIDAIQPGDVIRIPNPATQEPYEPPQLYSVQEGDSLQSIADNFSVTVKSLCQWNEISRDAALYPGMELTIPMLYTPPEETKPAEPAETEPAEEEDETVYVLGVPQYFQTDYPDTLYADGTVKTSGCSVTCLTMVANAVTGYNYTVDELADYFGGRAVNNMERLEIGSETLGLSFYKSENWDRTWEALRDGKIVIALMDGLEGPCLFTYSQHFIVLTGLNEDGKIMVNDPNPANYELWNLKNAFQNGFTPNDILLGYSGAWVYDRTLEETPERYSEPRLIKSEENKNYPQITLNEEERELLARVIWVEAQGECAEGQQAIAEVVFNRMLSDQFGDTLKDVIYSDGQFRSVPYLDDATPTQAQYQAIDRAMYGTPVLNKRVMYFATYPTNENIYQQIGNHIFCFG